MYKEIWNNLASVDCSGKIDKKGNLSYLSWAWAWAELMKLYPNACYSFSAPVAFDDGSMEVWCTVTIGDCSRQMWLPVMDHRNNSIIRPSSRQISDTRMRCLTKCLAMFGLGHYIYAGEDLPDPEVLQGKVEADYLALCERLHGSISAIQDGIANGELSIAAEAWAELTEDEKMGLWKAPSKGGCFTTKERDIMKTQEFRLSYQPNAKEQ